jgi:hypothetical protein
MREVDLCTSTGLRILVWEPFCLHKHRAANTGLGTFLFALHPSVRRSRPWLCMNRVRTDAPNTNCMSFPTIATRLTGCQISRLPFELSPVGNTNLFTMKLIVLPKTQAGDTQRSAAIVTRCRLTRSTTCGKKHLICFSTPKAVQ